MADDLITSEEQWRKVRRSARRSGFFPVITIRPQGTLALSADFVRLADLSSRSMATLFLSDDGRKLAIHFHNDEKDEDAYRIGTDGGGSSRKATKNRLIVANAIIKQSPTLAALVRDKDSKRRFEPVRIGADRWAITLMPCFEAIWGETVRFGRDQSGIYRYRNGAETVYIGRGNIRERLAEPERVNWQYDKIEYSIINDDAAERRWEAYWLDEYRRRWNRWPVYNRIAGRRSDEKEAQVG